MSKLAPYLITEENQNGLTILQAEVSDMIDEMRMVI